MANTRPQYFENTIQPIEINRETLQDTLQKLQSAIKNATELIRTGCPPPVDSSHYGSIYSGTPGIALSFLRLERQKVVVRDFRISSDIDFAQLARERVISTPTDLKIPPGRMSPIGSPLGPVFLRLLAACESGNNENISPDDVSAFDQAIQRSLQHGHVISFRDRRMGGDEVLYGRAGLLWAILTIENHITDEKIRRPLRTMLGHTQKLVDTIVEAGKNGAQDFVKQHGTKDAFPLMWPWLEEYYSLGAVHGITGILTILLSCDLSLLHVGEYEDDYLPLIADTITGLCRICIANGGHLLTSVPPFPRSRPSPLVQICHGAPGMLMLLAVAERHSFFAHSGWQPEWDEAIRLCTEKIWQEGLLTKGGNLCHGLTGNALPLLVLHDTYEYDSYSLKSSKRSRHPTHNENPQNFTGDYFLSRALPFMLLARESPPYSSQLNLRSSYAFRMPDAPYSLYEGLAGQLCAWAETCAVIQARLRKMQLEEENKSLSELLQDETFQKYLDCELGFPGLGANGPDNKRLG